jgi:hypothetical protein
MPISGGCESADHPNLPAPEGFALPFGSVSSG